MDNDGTEIVNGTSVVSDDSVPPRRIGDVGVSNPITIDIRYFEPITNTTVIDLSRFSFTGISGYDPNIAPTISSASISGNTLTLMIAEGAIRPFDSDPRFNYVSDGTITDLSGNTIPSITNALIRNNEFHPQIRVSDISPSSSDPPAKIGDNVTVTVSAEFFEPQLIVSGTPQINGQDAVFREVGNGVYTFTITVAEDTGDVANAAQLSVHLQLQTDVGRRAGNTISEIAASSAPAIDATRPVVSVDSVVLVGNTNNEIAKIDDIITINVVSNPIETDLTVVGDPTIGGLAAIFAVNHRNGTYSITTLDLLTEDSINVGANEALPINILFQDAAGNNASTPIDAVSASVAPTIDTILPTITSASVATSNQIRVVFSELVRNKHCSNKPQYCLYHI